MMFLCQSNTVDVSFVTVALGSGSVSQRGKIRKSECKEDRAWCCIPYRSRRIQTTARMLWFSRVVDPAQNKAPPSPPSPRHMHPRFSFTRRKNLIFMVMGTDVTLSYGLEWRAGRSVHKTMLEGTLGVTHKFVYPPSYRTVFPLPRLDLVKLPSRVPSKSPCLLLWMPS
jgi:hypothetical protein